MQNLEEYSIYELRQIARSMGVKAPTTKKHSELIDEIKKIQNKEIAPIKTTKGRPAKSITINYSEQTIQKSDFSVINKNELLKILDNIQNCLNKIKRYL